MSEEDLFDDENLISERRNYNVLNKLEEHIEEDSRFKNIVLGQQVWNRFKLHFHRIARKHRKRSASWLASNTKSYNEQLACNELIAKAKTNLDESYIEGIKCFGDLLAKKRLVQFLGCMNNRGEFQKCSKKFKDLEEAIARRLEQSRYASMDDETRAIHKYCENQSRIFGFEEETSKMVMFSCVAPKICPTQHGMLVDCFIDNGGYIDKCTAPAIQLYSCHIQKHWDTVQNYYEKFDKGEL